MNLKLLLVAKRIPRSSTGKEVLFYRPLWWPCKPSIGENFGVSEKEPITSKIVQIDHVTSEGYIRVVLASIGEGLMDNKLLKENIGWTDTLPPDGNLQFKYPFRKPSNEKLF